MYDPIDVVIYHNPGCGTSRNTLAMIRNAGIEPHVVEYLKTPPNRTLIKRLLARARLTVRDVLREKGTPYAELGLADPTLTDDQLLDAIEAHPILLNRPLVASPWACACADPPRPCSTSCRCRGGSSSRRTVSASSTSTAVASRPLEEPRCPRSSGS